MLLGISEENLLVDSSDATEIKVGRGLFGPLELLADKFRQLGRSWLELVSHFYARARRMNELRLEG